MSIVIGVVIELEAHGLTQVYADRRWRDPAPGSSVIVVTSESTWAHGPTSAQYPLVKVLVFSTPSTDQPDAEQVGHPVAAEVRRALHVMDGMRYWGTERVLGSQHVGSALYEVEGHPDWRVRSLTFEVETG